MTIVGKTRSSRDALDHLRSVKPNDGWSIQIQHNDNDDDGVRLLRRNAPLTDHYFLDIHYSPKTNAIVGLLTKDAETCQILVDGTNGRPVLQKNVEYVSCANSYRGYQKLTASEMDQADAENKQGRGSILGSLLSSSSSSSAAASGASASAAAPSRATIDRGRRQSRSNIRTTARRQTTQQQQNNTDDAFPNPFADMSEEDKERYFQYAMLALGAWMALKVLSSLFSETLLFALVLPGLYLYGLQTCPANSSFEPKKEVKRVLRGYHLPDDHPNKPRKGNFLEEWTAKITASVATEVGAVAGGYSLEMTPLLGGVATHAIVTLPTLGLTCEWIGCNDTWYHYRTYAATAR
eukprot:CAMPEP_0172358594 /NCGR_PEP_ID=MMETSP1060-20121228/2895_1 /TAXON_ID=37318 /ORGANISM="Pseudo-nitzschia pungens, Strain cf. cingulata" /LENGTH=349 /DNA_ID=CAMNT_0013079879 /DNA_START=194 /DNA_END=1243 /DNA_ORIENTATION=+